jgi:hypothetical protein
MPSPKWKLVVDIGDIEVEAPAATSAVVAASHSAHMTNDVYQQLSHTDLKDHHDIRDSHDFGLLAESVSVPAATVASMPIAIAGDMRDTRINEVVTLLGESMPSDPNAPFANYLSGFMSLRLLLLRQSRSLDDEELVRTILESYTSYSASGRDRPDIAIMLARDYIFLSQQLSQNAFLGLGQSMMSAANQGASNNSGLSLFGLPSTSFSLQNSPALTPIPAPGAIDSMSIVSN